jgi:uncharacterized surface protein with fasciclin (FAS1) repeats
LVNNLIKKYRVMKLRNQLLKIVAVLSLGIVSISCDNNTTEIAKLPSTVDIIKADANYSVFVKALDVTGLTATLSNPGSYTVLLPNNNAFATYSSTLIPAGTLIDANVNSTILTTAQQGELKRLMLNHLLGVATRSGDLPSDDYLKTLSPFGTSTSITLSMYFNKTSGVVINGGVINKGATVTQADIETSNGVIHKVDSVIYLPTLDTQLKANPNLSSFTTALATQATVNGYVQTPIANTQIFVPNNNAFTVANSPVDVADPLKGYLLGKSSTDVAKILSYHFVTAGTFTQTAVIGTSTGNINNGSSTTTSFLPSSATTDATVTTRAATAQTFLVPKTTLKINEIPALPTIPAANMKIVNIHTSNGIIHIVDRVLRPLLP